MRREARKMLETSSSIPTYELPGPKGKAIFEAENALETMGTKTAPIVVKRAAGLMVEDVDGNVFLDFTSGMVTATGHAHPDVVVTWMGLPEPAVAGSVCTVPPNTNVQGGPSAPTTPA